MTFAAHLLIVLNFPLFKIGTQPITPYDLLAVSVTMVVTVIVAKRVWRMLEQCFLKRLPVDAGAHMAR